MKGKENRLEAHDKGLAKEGRVLAHKDNFLKAESKGLTRKIASEKTVLPGKKL